MAYKTLLAHQSNDDVSPAVLQVASLLAGRHSAHLVGLHIQPPLDLYLPEFPIPVDLTREFLERQNQKQARLKRPSKQPLGLKTMFLNGALLTSWQIRYSMHWSNRAIRLI